MNKKAVSLSLETLVIAIVVLIVLFLVAFFIVKYGGQAGSIFGEQARTSTFLLPNQTAP